MNCLHSLRTGNRFKLHENASKNHGYCYIEISEWDSHILRHKHGEKSMKVPFVIYAEIEYLLEKNRHMP